MAYVSDVFDAAMGLMDELSPTGTAQTSDTQDYKFRTPAIIGIMTAEFKLRTGGRGAFAAVSALDDYINGIDDAYALGVMPYGLAANLLIDENPAAASFFQQRYEQLQYEYIRHRPALFEAIENVYGGIEHGEAARW